MSLVLPAFFWTWARQLGWFRQIKTNLVLHNFQQCNVSNPEVPRIRYERTAHRAGAGIELAHAAGNEVDQNVGIANLLQCFFR